MIDITSTTESQLFRCGKLLGAAGFCSHELGGTLIGFNQYTFGCHFRIVGAFFTFWQ